ncbi:ribbon-helix-helix protein, CopG family [Thermococcus sp. MV11]|uniref:ribbon-helix-helix protein, CopG family n=1 Tax=Thermococcus sp. MV11 TaxID=1638267 RepID=UPI001431341B|nr:ribbon-helix-helix protein, CopG family [Thermococcus sp. MV11]NJE04194.1 ribbon-helix-helix protein, CopG family [Thermococcus sp. MV11]
MRTKTVSARVEVEFYEKVKALAEGRGITVSDVVRQALENELDEAEVLEQVNGMEVYYPRKPRWKKLGHRIRALIL